MACVVWPCEGTILVPMSYRSSVYCALCVVLAHFASAQSPTACYPFDGGKEDASGSGIVTSTSTSTSGGNPSYSSDRFGNSNSAANFTALSPM